MTNDNENITISKNKLAIALEHFARDIVTGEYVYVRQAPKTISDGIEQVIKELLEEGRQ